MKRASTITKVRRLLASRLLWLVLALLSLQSALFLAFITHRLDMLGYMGLHLVICLAVATLGRWWTGDHPTISATALQLAAWTALGGPFGTFVAAALLVSKGAEPTPVHGLTITGGKDCKPTEMTRLQRLHGSLLDRRLRLESAHTVRPLMDVIIDGSQAEKFDALGLIFKHYDPSLAPALKHALKDSDGLVRVLAATVLAQLHASYSKRIGACQTTAQQARSLPLPWRDLAQARLDYAESELLDPSRVEAETRRALDHLSLALELDPGDAKTASWLEATSRHAILRGQAAVGVSAERHDILCHG